MSSDPDQNVWDYLDGPPVIKRRQSRIEDCATCARDPQQATLMPPHDPSVRCESGKRSHCSCDTCF